MTFDYVAISFPGPFNSSPRKGLEMKEPGKEVGLRGMLAYCSIASRGCPCLCSQIKVKPFMKLKTNERKDRNDLWFILEGKGANSGSLLQARCKGKGGGNGACKHIAAAIYALEDLLNTRGEDSVTSGPCVWVRRPRANTQIYPQNIETDVRAPQDTNPADEEYLGEFTKRLCNLKSTPVILPLFKQLHGTPEEDTITEEPCQSSHHRPKTGKLNAKRLEILRNDPKICLSVIQNESRLREQLS